MAISVEDCGLRAFGRASDRDLTWVRSRSHLGPIAISPGSDRDLTWVRSRSHLGPIAISPGSDRDLTCARSRSHLPLVPLPREDVGEARRKGSVEPGLALV